MQAPTCRLCGAAHWSNAPHVFKPSVTEAGNAAQGKPGVTRKVTPSVTEAVTRAQSVSDVTEAVTLEALAAEVAGLRADVARLAALVEPAARLTPAEKQRAYRERKKA